ncbi:hypothetical protein GCM10015535_66350 [Streptomyces gelaticus]|uniref:VCBS repeat-containing protein n=1 Tax=Streptomyces gelaticus TaxID=285446 RepID=A0ABQ2W8Z5_9ACTN|nr:FG-GAP repeat protein [Streptomyces gelaticus]GGV96604.1 hypothetical protein GCM10015535_66350 [Streptomyces gelaticus]
MRGGFLIDLCTTDQRGRLGDRCPAIVGSGDMDHDGRQDILARTPAGAVYLYNANHTGGFSAPRKPADTRWKKYAKIT